MNLPILDHDKKLLNEVLAMPPAEQRSRPVIMRMKVRAWSWETIAALLQMPVSEVQTIAEGES
jgi:DNA-directed RNA polymerase specialized sigma24 family protein